ATTEKPFWNTFLPIMGGNQTSAAIAI
ncbi:hypothetical protein D046_7937B, partial [Vibrio parahaemolyticus V-223/04]